MKRRQTYTPEQLARRKEYRVEWNKRNPHRHKKYLYGLSATEFEALVKEHQNRCAICGTEFKNTTRHDRPCVDHNHETGKIRGLLCWTCNVGLGSFKDSHQMLLDAALYLERYEHFKP